MVLWLVNIWAQNAFSYQVSPHKADFARVIKDAKQTADVSTESSILMMLKIPPLHPRTQKDRLIQQLKEENLKLKQD